MFLHHLHTTCTLGRPKCLIRLWVYFWQNIYTQYCFLLYHIRKHPGASQVVQVVKNLPANAGDIRDMGLIPGLGRSLGEGHGNPLQYSCLENPMERGAWRPTVHGVVKSRTWPKWLSTDSIKDKKKYWFGKKEVEKKVRANMLMLVVLASERPRAYLKTWAKVNGSSMLYL